MRGGWEILYVFYGLMQLALYGPVLVLIVLATWRFQNKDTVGGCIFLALAAAPFGFYAVSYARIRTQIPMRDAEVASWPRTKITPDNCPAVLVVETNSNW